MAHPHYGGYMGFDARVYKNRKAYHKPAARRTYFGRDNDEAVRQIELFMAEECERRKIDWGTINKYEFAKKLGVYKEYFDALAEKRIHR